MLECSFFHVLETGASRRTHLRFHSNIAKRTLSCRRRWETATRRSGPARAMDEQQLAPFIDFALPLARVERGAFASASRAPGRAPSTDSRTTLSRWFDGESYRSRRKPNIDKVSPPP